MNYDASQPSVTFSSTPAHKRKLDETGFEIPDSDDEFGWGDDDEGALPGMPPQWQGSEDILLGQGPSEDEDRGDTEASEAEEDGEEDPTVRGDS